MNRFFSESKMIRLIYKGIFIIILILMVLFIIISTRMNEQYKETMTYTVETVTHISALEVERYFEPIILVDVLMSEFWNVEEDFEVQALRVEDIARRLIKMYPQITNIYFGNESGDFVMFFDNELGTGSVDSKISIWNVEKTIIKRYEDNEIVEVLVLPREDFDPRTRPWYLGTNELQSLFLTDPYIFYTSKKMGASVSRRIEDTNGFWGSYGIDIELDDLTKMLSNIKMINNGSAFIKMPNGAIITPDTASIVIDDYSSFIDTDHYGQPVLSSEGYLYVSQPITDVFQADLVIGIILDYQFFATRLKFTRTIIKAVFVLLFINMVLFVFVRLMNKLNRIKLIKIASSDPLTGLKNRHTFQDVYNERQEVFRRRNQKFSVAIADIDYFKCINDTHGHNVGDAILVEIANLIQSELRDQDIVFRWGGEEFLILFSKSDMHHAKAICERLRNKIEQYVFLRNDLNIKCTMSFGVSEHHKIMTSQDLIKAADDCLFESKSSGRNQLSF